jgi:hypothetical protein
VFGAESLKHLDQRAVLTNRTDHASTSPDAMPANSSRMAPESEARIAVSRSTWSSVAKIARGVGGTRQGPASAAERQQRHRRDE